MCWRQLLSTIQGQMIFSKKPVLILIHLGGNDIENQHIGQFITQIYKDIAYLRSVFVATHIVWSNILPRMCWQDQSTLIRKYRRINRAGRVALRQHTPGGIIVHDLNCDSPNLFRPDGIHLSDAGNDKFLDEFAEELQKMLCP